LDPNGQESCANGKIRGNNNKKNKENNKKNKLHHWFILQGTPAQQFSLTRREAVQRTSAKIQLPKSCKHKHLQLKGLGKRRSLPVMRS
jgi:hypothetical protein